MDRGPYGFPLGRSLQSGLFGFPLGETLKSTDRPPIGGYFLWLDGADAATILLSGSEVTDWLDKSGSANHASQTTSSARFTYAARTLNGIVVPEAAGTDDYMSVTTITAPRGYTYFQVLELDIVTGTRAIIGNNGDINNIHAYYTSNNLRLDMGGVAGTSGLTVSAGVAFAWCGVVRGSTIYYRRDGLVSDISNTASPSNNGSLRVGQSSQSFDGAIAEMIVYPFELTNDQVELVMQYLRAKWGLG